MLVLLAGAAAAYATRLTPELNRLNIALVLPMLGWTLAQSVLFHRPGRIPRWLSLVNALIDVTAVTALLAGYGLVGLPDLAVKSPIFLAYFAIIAARPLTGSAWLAAVVSAIAVVQYTILVAAFILSGMLPLAESPLLTVGQHGTSVFDEGAKILLLAVAGGIATYATAWHERTLRRGIAAQVRLDAEQRALIVRLQEADKLSAIGTLAATVAHEVNNPLAGIGTLAELLLHTPLTEEQRADVMGILAESRRTAGIVRELLRVAHPRDESSDSISLSMVAESALSAMRPMLHAQRVKVETALDPALPPVRGFPGRLEQVVLNLAINAVQAMEDRNGTRLLRVATGADGTHAWLDVEDSGPGFGSGTADHLFERFYTTKPPGKGTGLGLWIAHQIVTEHGGTIEAGNRPEGGARFRLRLPIR